MVSDIFGVITQAITNFASSLGDAVTNIASLFYAPASGSETSGHITFLGTLALIGVGCGIVYWAFRMIKGLIAQRRA